jgi:formylglycine-generating enzyme required for sulfatase activity
MNHLRIILALLSLLLSTAIVHGQVDSCAADINGDGIVAGDDLASVLGSWGPCSGCAADIVADQFVDGVDLAFILSRWGVTCAPTVTAISPAVGHYTGGTKVTISGTRLLSPLAVTFGGTPATVVSSTADAITAITPSGTQGSAIIGVTTIGGTHLFSNGYAYFSTPSWATLLEAAPNPSVVTNPTLPGSIIATGYPWRVRDNGTGIEMLLVPPGTFDMGCIQGSDSDGCNWWEQPVHTVTLTNAFYIGRYEVTQAQWQARMEFNPSFFQGQADSPSRPVEQVSWNTIQGFLSATGLRLPTEAEWECACRAGTTTPFHSGPGFPNGTTDDNLAGQIAWYYYNTCSGGSFCGTMPVGGKAANALGLHDMLGNLWEWCNDWYGNYSSAPQTDPTGPGAGGYRVVRGGSWSNPTGDAHSSVRTGFTPGVATSDVGFRVARNP